MILYPNIEGIKYFIYLITNNKNFIFFPQEIREKIWNMCEKKPYMLCNLNDNIKIKLFINV